MAYTVTVRVTWDRAKNVANQKKHGLSFEEASELFRSGVDYLELFDEDHSDDEDRFIAIGPIRRGLDLIPHIVPDLALFQALPVVRTEDAVAPRKLGSLLGHSEGV